MGEKTRIHKSDATICRSVAGNFTGKQKGTTVPSGIIQCVRFPLPEDLQQSLAYMNPEVVGGRIRKLLLNGQREGQTVEADINAVFPSEGFSMEKYKEFCNGHKDLVYKDPRQATAPMIPVHMRTFRSVASKAQEVVNSIKGNENVEKVFGTKKDKAKANYDLIHDKIKSLSDRCTSMATVDYNGDDAETGTGGYAAFYEQKVHFSPKTCEDNEHSQMTVIHECAHLSNATIRDKGYVGSPGFDTMKEEDKLTNAAHYEVAPGWERGMTDRYGAPRVFTPFVEGSGTETDEDLGRRAASEYFRKAWIKALNFLIRLKEYRTSTTGTLGHGKELKEFSQKMGLTLHRQDKWVVKVTLLDITLMENITRMLGKSMGEVKSLVFEGGADLSDKAAYEAYFKSTLIERLNNYGVTEAMVKDLQTRRL